MAWSWHALRRLWPLPSFFHPNVPLKIPPSTCGSSASPYVKKYHTRGVYGRRYRFEGVGEEAGVCTI